MTPQLELSDRFQDALQIFEDGRESAFITGGAGTGKSTLLRYARQTCARQLVVLAPTGVAALQVQGETIHSFFRFRPGITVAEAAHCAAHLKNPSFYQSIRTIVIDEISMVRADLLDCIDVFLRTALKRPAPFGGIQMIFIGDLYQLPPVVLTKEWHHFSALYETPYFFSARVMADALSLFRVIVLEKIYRQHDKTFQELLHAVRNGMLTDEQLALLNSRVIADETALDPDSIWLTTTTAAADRINNYRLSLLRAKPVTFHAEVIGDFDPHTAPAEVELRLKQGARVMFLNNDADGQWVNGTMGVVRTATRKEILVTRDDGGTVSVSPYTWTLYRYVLDTKTHQLVQESIGSFTQIPLQLAWAVTIHKSQGKTFDRVVVDFGRGTFASGQAYVALSRCRTLRGLLLKQPLRQEHIFVDDRIERFCTKLQDNREQRSGQR